MMDVDLRRTLGLERKWAVFNVVLFALALVFSAMEITWKVHAFMTFVIGLGCFHWCVRLQAITRVLDSSNLHD